MLDAEQKLNITQSLLGLIRAFNSILTHFQALILLEIDIYMFRVSNR